MIPQNMHTGSLHSGEGVGHVTGEFEVCFFIDIVDPIAKLDDDLRLNGVDPIHEGLHEIQCRGAQFRPLVNPVVNIGDECNPQGVCHGYPPSDGSTYTNIAEIPGTAPIRSSIAAHCA